MKTVLLSFFQFDDVCIHIFVKATPIFFFWLLQYQTFFLYKPIISESYKQKEFASFQSQ